MTAGKWFVPKQPRFVTSLFRARRGFVKVQASISSAMNARSLSQLVRTRRAEAVLFATLGTAALLCFVFAGATALRQPPVPAAPNPAMLAQLPVSTTQHVASYPPRWRAELRTAYHAAVYLLDPTA